MVATYTVRSGGKINHFFTCFKPLAAEDRPEKPGYVLGPDPFSGEACRRRRKRKSSRSFSGVIKAVFRAAPLMNNFNTKENKDQEDAYPNSSSNSSFTKEKDFKFSSSKDISRNPSSSSLSSTSSITSSHSSNSRSGSERMIKRACSQPSKSSRPKPKKRDLENCGGDSVVIRIMLIFMVCLIALLYGGKIFAIVTCTSAWILLAHCQSKSGDFPAKDALFVSDEEYKKRVVMEGLLERNHAKS